jgi:aspartyl/asparaginyl-tRNA synthetase
MGTTESTRFRPTSSDSVSSRESHVVQIASCVSSTHADSFKANKIVLLNTACLIWSKCESAANVVGFYFKSNVI